MFKEGDKVIIKANEFCKWGIGGIINHLTTTGKKRLFGKDFNLFITSHWEKELQGDIFKVGNYNTYIIRDGNNYYCFNNDYEEMKLLEE